MKIKDDGDWIQLNVIIEKYKETRVPIRFKGKDLMDPEGNPITEIKEKFIKEILVPTKFLKSGISLVSQTLNDKYKVLKSKATIFDTYSQRTYVVKHTIDEIDKTLKNRPIIGFKVGRNQ